MRNPALRLVGIGVSPQGGGVFGTRAEEELRLWLETRLDALGIDPVAYSRFVLSLLRRPDSALSPPHGEGVYTGHTAGGGGRRHRAKPRPRIQGDRDQRHAVVQCLTNAADQKCGVESLVDELCAKLRDLEGGGSNEDKEECRKIDGEKKNTVVETLTPRDRALRYYAAFPALQPATPKKTIHKKDKNTAGVTINHKNRIFGINGNNIKNSNKNNNSSHNRSGGNIRGRNRKSKMPIQTIDAQRSANKETFGFAKSMEREREKERELELDQLRLAQLQAKFDESLEALWDTGPSNDRDKASIWAAPSLSIPSGPLWPVDTGEMPLILPIHDVVSTATTPYQDDSIVDDSPIITWDMDSIRKYTDDASGKDKIDYNLNWSDYIGDGPWNWKDLGNNLMNMSKSPKATGCFIPVTPRKSPILNSNNNSNNNNNKTSNNININNNNNNNNNNNTKESSPQQKVNSLEEVDEDLLTSARTHFRPIKDDGHWADGTTFPVNNNIERVTYRRSESGNLLYLPGDESPYMEYRESTTPLPITSANLTLKFRVRQCDKSIQTDPIRSPIKRRIIAEADHFYYSPVDADDILTHESDDIEKDSFTLGQLGWMQPSVSLLNDRKRRHSSSFHCRPLAALRPLTL